MIRIKRIYDTIEAADGHRVLVDRLWPRGVKRDVARIDVWPKAIAPSTGLRKWYDHRPERWEEFQVRYRGELDTDEARADLARLRQLARRGTITLLTATRAEQQTHATVLKELIEI